MTSSVLLPRSCVFDSLQVREGVVLFVTRALGQLKSGLLIERKSDRPRPGVNNWIGDSRFVVDLVGTDWSEAFHYVLGVAHNIASLAEPGLAVEVGRFHDERIAFPSAH